MPSNSDPSLVVNPGAGRVPAAAVPSGALIPPGGGGGGGPVLASNVAYSGDGNWEDGTTNPPDTVDAQLTKIVGDLTNVPGGTSASPHSGSDRISARQTAASFVDGSTVNGTSAQALVEAIITALQNDQASTTDHHSGADRVSARQTVEAFADGSVVNNTSIQGLVANTIQALGSGTRLHGTAAAITVSGGTVTVSGLFSVGSLSSGACIELSGSTNSCNNGVYAVVSSPSTTEVVITNANAITDVGPISWSVAYNDGANRVGSSTLGTTFADGATNLTSGAEGSVRGMLNSLAVLLSKSYAGFGNNLSSITIAGDPSTPLSGTFHVTHGISQVYSSVDLTGILVPGYLMVFSLSGGDTAAVYEVASYVWNVSGPHAGTGTIYLYSLYLGVTQLAATAEAWLSTTVAFDPVLTGVTNAQVGQLLTIYNDPLFYNAGSFTILSVLPAGAGLTIQPVGTMISETLTAPNELTWSVPAGARAGTNLIGSSDTLSTWADGQPLKATFIGNSFSQPNMLPGTMGVTNGLATVSTSEDLTKIVFPGNTIFITRPFLAPPSTLPWTVQSVNSSQITLTTPYTGSTDGPVGASLGTASLHQQIEQLVYSLGGAGGMGLIGAAESATSWADLTILAAPANEQSVGGMFDALVTELGGSTGTAKIGGAAVTNSAPLYSLAASGLAAQLTTLLGAVNNQFNVRTVAAPGGIGRVQHHAANGSLSATFPSPNTAGNFLIASIIYHTTTNVDFISDSAGNVWNWVTEYQDPTSGYGVAIAICQSPKTFTGNTVTIAVGAGTDHYAVEVQEYSASETLVWDIQNEANQAGLTANTATSITNTFYASYAGALVYVVGNAALSTASPWVKTGSISAAIDEGYYASGTQITFFAGDFTSSVGSNSYGFHMTGSPSTDWATAAIILQQGAILDADGVVDSFINFTAATLFKLTFSGNNHGRRIYIADSSGALSASNPILLVPGFDPLTLTGDTINGLYSNFPLTTPYGRWMLQCGASNDWYVFAC